MSAPTSGPGDAGGTLPERLAALASRAEAAAAGATDVHALTLARAAFLGKKGELSGLLRGLGSLTPEERPRFGAHVNATKERLEALFDEAQRVLEARGVEASLTGEAFDVSVPGRRPWPAGALHPVTQTSRLIEGVLTALGFDPARGPEVESDENNFARLNFPKDHPARDMQDTFYVASPGGQLLMRTHTSPVQVRAMLGAGTPPVRVFCPGAVYRCDMDVTHSPRFHQIEGLWIDEGVSFAHLKGVLTAFVRGVFGANLPVRFRPSFFPFVEPGAEMDMGCTTCFGVAPAVASCRVCKGTGWLEILGAGMVHPNVLALNGIDPERWSGFAFGLGIERVAMLRYGINDLRLLFDGDVRFLSQFRS